jgi:nitroreductase
MKFQELILIRQSVRSYDPKPVEKEKIDLVLEAARLSPSACNSQPWYIVVVDNPELKAKVADATFSRLVSFNKFTTQAPVLLVVVMEKPRMISQVGGRIKNREYPLYDIGIVSSQICLQAAELGLGTCMMGWFDEKGLMKILDIPKKLTVGLVISLGYPSENYKLREKMRKPLNEICDFNGYKK